MDAREEILFSSQGLAILRTKDMNTTQSYDFLGK